MFLAHLLLYSTGTVAKDAEDDTFIKEGKDNQYGDWAVSEQNNMKINIDHNFGEESKTPYRHLLRECLGREGEKFVT